jgi:hypothetical protein
MAKSNDYNQSPVDCADLRRRVRNSCNGPRGSCELAASRTATVTSDSRNVDGRACIWAPAVDAFATLPRDNVRLANPYGSIKFIRVVDRPVVSLPKGDESRYRSGCCAKMIALREVGPTTNYRPDFLYDAQ